MAQIIKLTNPDPFRAAVVAINQKFDKETDCDRKVYNGTRAGNRCRLEAGQLLLALRKRIEDGEAGAEWKEKWWSWYGWQGFSRPRRDASKVMKMAAADDPEAAHADEKAAARKGMRRLRAGPNKNVSDHPKVVRHHPEVAVLLEATSELTRKLRQQYFNALEEQYHDEIQVRHAEGDGRAIPLKHPHYGR